MRLDHFALRVSDRFKTAQFLIDAFDYRIQTEFELDFEDGTHAKCLALEPSEKSFSGMPLFNQYQLYNPENKSLATTQYHMAPEIFVSDGDPDSIIGKWVKQRIDCGGNLLHHMAYQVDDVKSTMELWKQKGWAEFTTEEPLNCPGLVQVFTKPHILTGLTYEFINRSKYGFCAENVKRLMMSSEENK